MFTWHNWYCNKLIWSRTSKGESWELLGSKFPVVGENTCQAVCIRKKGECGVFHNCESLVKTYKATMRFKICLRCFPFSVRIFLFVGISQFSKYLHHLLIKFCIMLYICLFSRSKNISKSKSAQVLCKNPVSK